MLVVEKFPGANTLEVTEGVEEALETLEPGLSGMQVDDEVFRPAGLIEQALDNLTLALVIGGVLLAAALAAFLFEWRAALVSLVAIPSSLIAAALLLDLLGQPLNAIAFACLAAAVAVVVDDAVVGVENVLRRLRQHRDERGTKWTSDVVLEATAEVRSPAAYATLILLLAADPRHGRFPRRVFRATSGRLPAGGAGVAGGGSHAHAGLDRSPLLQDPPPCNPRVAHRAVA